MNIKIIEIEIFKICVDATTLMPKRTFLPEPHEFSLPPKPC